MSPLGTWYRKEVNLTFTEHLLCFSHNVRALSHIYVCYRGQERGEDRFGGIRDIGQSPGGKMTSLRPAWPHVFQSLQSQRGELFAIVVRSLLNRPHLQGQHLQLTASTFLHIFKNIISPFVIACHWHDKCAFVVFCFPTKYIWFLKTFLKRKKTIVSDFPNSLCFTQQNC